MTVLNFNIYNGWYATSVQHVQHIMLHTIYFSQIMVDDTIYNFDLVLILISTSVNVIHPILVFILKVED
jgi:hypothetical protein